MPCVIGVEAVLLEVVVLEVVVANDVLADADVVLAEAEGKRIADLHLALIRIRRTEGVVRLAEHEAIAVVRAAQIFRSDCRVELTRFCLGVRAERLRTFIVQLAAILEAQLRW